MKLSNILLILLLTFVQYSVWFGNSGWVRLWELNSQSVTQKSINNKLYERNLALKTEIKDLKTGYDAVEEKARSSLGLVKKGEIFYKVILVN